MHLAPGESNSDIFYTSDYDLSALNAHKYGVGLKYYPSYGLLRSRPIFDTHGVFMFKYIELRTAMYKRSTDLSAYNVSINLAFSYK